MRAVSGCLSGDPTQLHFGLAPGIRLTGLTIRWLYGAVSQVDSLAVNQHVMVTR